MRLWIVVFILLLGAPTWAQLVKGADGLTRGLAVEDQQGVIDTLGPFLRAIKAGNQRAALALCDFEVGTQGTPPEMVAHLIQYMRVRSFSDPKFIQMQPGWYELTFLVPEEPGYKWRLQLKHLGSTWRVKAIYLNV